MVYTPHQLTGREFQRQQNGLLLEAHGETSVVDEQAAPRPDMKIMLHVLSYNRPLNFSCCCFGLEGAEVVLATSYRFLHVLICRSRRTGSTWRASRNAGNMFKRMRDGGGLKC